MKSFLFAFGFCLGINSKVAAACVVFPLTIHIGNNIKVSEKDNNLNFGHFLNFI